RSAPQAAGSASRTTPGRPAHDSRPRRGGSAARTHPAPRDGRGRYRPGDGRRAGTIPRSRRSGVPSRGPASYDQPPPLQLVMGFLHAVMRLLDRDRLHEFEQRVLEMALGPEAEACLRLRDVGDAVADVAGPRPAEDLGLEVVTVHRPRERTADLADR